MLSRNPELRLQTSPWRGPWASPTESLPQTHVFYPISFSLISCECLLFSDLEGTRSGKEVWQIYLMGEEEAESLAHVSNDMRPSHFHAISFILASNSQSNNLKKHRFYYVIKNMRAIIKKWIKWFFLKKIQQFQLSEKKMLCDKKFLPLEVFKQDMLIYLNLELTLPLAFGPYDSKDVTHYQRFSKFMDSLSNHGEYS